MKKTLLFAILSLCAMASLATPPHTGKVIESMDVGAYTYVKVKNDKDTFWIAGPKTTVRKGGVISFDEQMWAENFKSKSLDRVFDRVMFVSRITSDSMMAKPVTAQPHKEKKVIGITKSAGQLSVVDVFSKKDELKGKTISIKGEVVKVSKNIMSRTWVHIQDGTGDSKTNDLIFRTTEASTPEVGTIITAQGRVVTDQDFGHGYSYPVLVEDATFSQ